MTDELDLLKAAMKAATPRPDPNQRADTLRLAAENFARHQGSQDPARPSSESHPAVGRLQMGLNAMIRSLTPLRGALVATTALVAVGVILVLPQSGDLLSPPDADRAIQEATQELPTSQTPVEETFADTRSDAETATSADRNRAAAPAPAPPAPRAAKPAQTGPLAKRAEGESAVGGLLAPIAEPVRDALRQQPQDTEAFANADQNPVKVTLDEPVSTFSIDVDTASFSVVRSSLMRGQLPPPDAVRVEEMVNYFPYAYPAPTDGQAFRPTVSVLDTPWNADTRLVHIALQGALPALNDRPPLNLVFLIDTSGSMQDIDKLPLLKQSFRLMLNELRPEDQVAIVTYAGSAGQVLAPTPASDRGTILAALNQLGAGGSTAGQAGLEQAYAVAEGMARDGAVSRILLATDGDFNVGISDPEALKDFIAQRRDSGTYLSVLGFGRGNLDDATMQALAQNGNGTASYIDTLGEARKVLVDQLTGALFPIADDVKIQVEWNPATVAEYRLIGYETRALRREDFNNDRIDAGEIGAGHSVTAIYEVTPVGSAAVLNDPLRYQTEPAARGTAEELGFLRLRFKSPGAETSQLIETPIPLADTHTGEDVRFATAIAAFGQMLRASPYLNGMGYDEIIALANGAKGTDPYGYRAEAVTLMRLAEGLSGN